MAIAALNLNALQNSRFRRIASEPKEQLYKYRLMDGLSNNDLLNTAKSVEKLLSKNSSLVALFDTNTNQIINALRVRKFLVINRNAVCLHDNIDVPEGAEPYMDACFSTGLLKNPVKCEDGHYLEKEYCEFWLKKSNYCPDGEDHKIVKEGRSLRVDRSQKTIIKQCLANLGIKESVDKVSKYSREVVRLNSGSTYYIEKYRASKEQEKISKTIQCAVKIGARCSIFYAAKQTAKGAGKKVAKETGKRLARNVARKGAKKGAKKTVAKTLPFISFFIGLACGAERLYRGQQLEAVGEVVSGIAGCFPGPGTAVSIVIDAVLLAKDIDSIQKEIVDADKNLLEMACAAFSISNHDIDTISKQKFDQAYRDAAKIFHPDHSQGLSEDTAKYLEDIMKGLNHAKDLIYKHRNW